MRGFHFLGPVLLAYPVAMCGRYALNATAGELIEHFRAGCLPAGRPLQHRAAEQHPGHPPEARRRSVGQLVKWGLIPSWAKDSSIGNKLSNARSETAADKPAFAQFQAPPLPDPANGTSGERRGRGQGP